MYMNKKETVKNMYIWLYTYIYIYRGDSKERVYEWKGDRLLLEDKEMSMFM